MYGTLNNATACGKLLVESKSVLVYGGVGAFGTTVHFMVLFTALNFAGPVLASTLGAIAGCIVNYFLARQFVFSVNRTHRYSFPRFVTVAIIGIVVNASVIHAFVGVLPIAFNQTVASAVVLLLGYTLNKWWTFNGR